MASRLSACLGVQVESQRRPSSRAQKSFERILHTSLPASSTSADSVAALMQQRFDERPKGFTEKQCT